MSASTISETSVSERNLVPPTEFRASFRSVTNQEIDLVDGNSEDPPLPKPGWKMRRSLFRQYLFHTDSGLSYVGKSSSTNSRTEWLSPVAST